MTTTSPGSMAVFFTASKASSSRSKTRAGPACAVRSWPGLFPPRALVADDHHVPRLDGVLLHRLESVLLPIEDARRPRVRRALVAGHLHHCTVPREGAAARHTAA